MKQSTERILTTHTGSLPRPKDLLALLQEREEGRLHDRAALDTRVRSAVADVVNKQAECGLAVINDGEQGKVDYTIYVKDRLTGFEGESSPIRISGGVEAEEIFMTSPSPGQIGRFLRNQYYPSDEEYLYRLAEVMRREYRAIVEAGFLLQLDCPDLALGRHTQFAHLSLEEFRKVAAMHVEVLNDAVRDIAPDRMRMHICWASTGGPHLRDVPLKDIVDIVLKGRPHRRLRLRFRDLRRPGAGGLEYRLAQAPLPGGGRAPGVRRAPAPVAQRESARHGLRGGHCQTNLPAALRSARTVSTRVRCRR